MDFDFTTETITPDQSALLTIGGTGAIEVPTGSTANRPVTGLANGALRYNTDIVDIEGYINNAWVPLSTSTTAVTTFSAGTTGFTPASATSGPIVLAGTLNVANGGTGLTTAPTNGQIDIGSTGVGFVRTTITAGTAVSVTNAAGSITIANTGVTSAIGTAGDITVSSATGAVTFDLATITQGAGSNFVKVTLDTKGRVTGNSAVVQADLTGLLGTYYLPSAGGTMSGAINMGTNQINNLGMAVTPAGTDAVNVNYVQAQLTGLSWKQAVKAATTGVLTANYANGVAGVGATLTATTNVVLPTIDTVSLAVNDRVLVKNQGTTLQNGIYSVTSLGSAGTAPWVLTRTSDSDTAVEVNGSAVYVDQGSTNLNTGWTETANVVTMGTDPITWAQFSGSGTYAAGTGIALTGNTFSNTGVLSFQTSLSGLTPSTASTGVVTLGGTLGPASGGTGATAVPTNGQVLVGNGTNFTVATLGTGTGISTTTGAGTLTINNTGVTSAVAGTGITVSSATGAVTITNAGVTSFSAGTTGLTPNSATTGAVTLAGTLAVANGGTGLTTAPTNGQIDIGSTGVGFVRTTITAGTGISVTNGAGSITVANTGVTSVGLALPSFITVSGSPVTTTGTLTGTLASQTANTAFLAPNGSAGAPTFRGIVFADLTGALLLYRENPSTPTTPLVAGTNAVAIGSGSSASGTQTFAVGSGTSAVNFGNRAYANGSFATAGDAQEINAVLRNLTTTATATELFLDGVAATQRMVLPANSVWTATIKVSARRTDATGVVGSWVFNTMLYRDATAATTTMVGTSKTTIARVGLGGGNDPVLSADTTNGSLKITVTGNAAQTIRWVATVELAQVTN